MARERIALISKHGQFANQEMVVLHSFFGKAVSGFFGVRSRIKATN